MMEENGIETFSWKYFLTPTIKANKEAQESVQVIRRNAKNTKIHSGNHSRLKTKMSKTMKVKCPDCDTMLYPKTLLVHKRYFCNKEPPKNLEFKMLNNSLALCLKCKRKQHYNSIILHSKYTCNNRYIRCFYCPAVFKGHTTKRSLLMTHIRKTHSKGLYEVNDLVSKLNPEDFHKDENGVLYTMCQTSEVEKQTVHKNVIEENFEKILIKQEIEDSEDLFIKQENPEPTENVLIKEESKEDSDILNDSQFHLHCAYPNISFSNETEVKKDFIPLDHKKEAKKDLLSYCPKCSKLICSSVKRLHKKYFCGKTPNDRLGWIIDESSTVGATCLKCGKNSFKPHLIEFHMAYICGKKQMSVQCFYCDEFYNNYNSLLFHMKFIHKRKHERLDLLSVLPPAEDVSSGETANENDQSKIVKVYFGGFNNILPNLNGFGPAEYKCFYCDIGFAYVFQSLDHMEEEHSMKHNTYDVLRNHFVSF